MEKNQIISITPILCPHCNKEIAVKSIMGAPVVTDVFTPEDIKEAKEEAIKKINELKNIDQQLREGVLNWVNTQDTVFGPKDVDEIITNIKTQNNDLIKNPEVS